MQLLAGKKVHRAAAVALTLLAFGLRALIAPGFMPASAHGFPIEICPEGFPADLLKQAASDAMPGMGDMSGMAGMPGMDAAMPDMQGDGSAPAPLQPGGGHSHMEHCWFGTACASAPPLQHPPVAEVLVGAAVPALRADAAALSVRLVFLPHSRGPPLTA